MIGPFVGVLFDGFAYGTLLFLLSVGLSVTLGMMNFINLAHCSFAMLGGYVAVTLVDRLGGPFFATLPAAVLFSSAGGVAAALGITVNLLPALEWTRFGAEARGAVDNQRLARGLGINVVGVFAVTFSLGSGLAGLGGALAIAMVGLDPSFAFAYLVYVLIVVSVGGLASIRRSFPCPG